MREVNPYGVSHVMKQFFYQHKPLKAEGVAGMNEDVVSAADVICDEMLLKMAAAQ